MGNTIFFADVLICNHIIGNISLGKAIARFIFCNMGKGCLQGILCLHSLMG
ncbi:hypothetical protein ADICEAN_02295 [Cesiribacter andamanensis AMV16]|uniref:Uncharacterized protein n=1 Tax=Cesiribacter andamanensis AMV16 TaxID=1279009 RepID=M7NVT8_9BACT|nr:hypothetical protein ADICEAN_02295 [Cesiribacter andamanensis AMV16]